MTDSRPDSGGKNATSKMWHVPCMITRRNQGGGGTLSLVSRGSAAEGVDSAPRSRPDSHEKTEAA